MSAPVTVRGLDVVLGDQRVLHGVDLTVGPGEVLALLGSNGSGKSTLVRAIVRLLRPENGTIELFGTPINRFRDWRRIGYVPQRSTAAGGVPATVREVVGTGRLAHRAPFTLRSRADRVAVDRALELVGLADRAQDNVVDLSGGQQQRVLIARAAASEPDLLVLDEPTAGVDVHNQAVFADAVGGFVAAGKAVLVVLHELGPFAPLVDHAVELDGGRVVRDGPLEHRATGEDAHAFHDHSHAEGHPLDPATDRGLFG